jgi:hypothetical protein
MREPKAKTLARDFGKALAKRGCTFGEIWEAFAVTLSFLLDSLPSEARHDAYRDLIVGSEKMIAENREAGIKGAPVSRRH